jgi:hypothetical protein
MEKERSFLHSLKGRGLHCEDLMKMTFGLSAISGISILKVVGIFCMP